MKAFSQKRPLLFSLVISIISVVLLDVTFFVGEAIFSDLDIFSMMAIHSATQLILSVGVLLIARHLYIVKGWFKASNTLKGLMMGWFAILYAVVMILLTSLSIQPEYWIVPKPWPFFVVISVAFTTGLFEEILVRGLVLNLLINKIGDSRQNAIKACWISSVLFGALHIFNLTSGAGIIETVGQIIYATFVGMFFAAIYLRTKSLWAPIILHALVDIPDSLFGALVSDEAIEIMAQDQVAQSMQETISTTLMQIALSIICLIIAFFLLRKKKYVHN